MQVGDVFNPKGMFFGAFVPNWLLRRKEITGHSKLVYGRLYQFCNEEGRAFPKLKTLAEELGCSVSGIKNAIGGLEACRLILVTDHFGTHRASDYRFLWHEWIEEAVSIREPESNPRGSQKVTLAAATTWPPRELQVGSPLNESAEEVQPNINQRKAPLRSAHTPRLERNPNEKKVKNFRSDKIKPPLRQSLSPDLLELRSSWRDLLAEHFPQYPKPSNVWTAKEYEFAETLLAAYGIGQSRLMCAFVVMNWQMIKDRMFKGEGSPIPGIGLVINGRLSSTFAASAKEWSEQGAIVEEYERTGRPRGMTNVFNEAKRRLAAIGVKV